MRVRGMPEKTALLAAWQQLSQGLSAVITAGAAVRARVIDRPIRPALINAGPCGTVPTLRSPQRKGPRGPVAADRLARLPA
jgi:hypothetical protein